MKEDSDGDSLSDFEEYELSTNPHSVDTDKDSITDFDDEYPLSPSKIEPDPSKLEIGRAIILGAVFGECGIEGGSLAGFVDSEIASSPYYLVGWIGFSLVPGIGAVADARDAVQALINGDELGAALNAAGVLSGVGDGVKTGAALTLFVGKYPSKLSEVRKIVVPLLKYVPLNQAKKVILDSLYKGGATRLLKLNAELNVDDLIVIAQRGTLEKTIGAVKSADNGRLMWLEEGKLGSAAGATKWVEDFRGSGWIHIKNNRFDNPTGNQFLRYGSKYSDLEEVKALILEAAKYGSTFINKKGTWRKYEVPESGGKYLHVLVGSNGYIVTTIPGDVI